MPWNAGPTSAGITGRHAWNPHPVKNKAERSQTFPRELWPILPLIFTGPVLFVNMLLGGDRALQRAWIIALIGLACFSLLGRHK